ncbi:MAG: hypothetical protein JWM02_2853 [Frankiales bacterium]|nr:hypothetical protein [Frankiales bacterium]
MKGLKRASDALFVLAVALLVVAVVTSNVPVYLAAGASLVVSVVLTVVRRNRARAVKAQT